MKKSDWQYLVDTLLFICIVGIATIGFLMGLVIPKGPAASESSKYFLGLHRHQWGNIHFYLSITFTVLVIIHLILSWKWIKGKASQLFKKRWGTVLIYTAVVSFLVLVLFWVFFPKYPRKYEGYGTRGGERAKDYRTIKSQTIDRGYILAGKTAVSKEDKDSIVITGQMTFLDVEKATGVASKKIIDALGLPSKVSLNETLGRLRKRYGFSMEQIRNIVSRLMEKSLEEKENLLQEKSREHKEKNKLPTEKREHKEKMEKEREVSLTRGRREEGQSGILITGRMTLYDIERKTGISAREIADKLDLPQSAPLNETLGRLRKRYLFTLQEVREVVSYLMKKK